MVVNGTCEQLPLLGKDGLGEEAAHLQNESGQHYLHQPTSGLVS
jgi:hypothetical protein